MKYSETESNNEKQSIRITKKTQTSILNTTVMHKHQNT